MGEKDQQISCNWLSGLKFGLEGEAAREFAALQTVKSHCKVLLRIPSAVSIDLAQKSYISLYLEIKSLCCKKAR